MGRKRRFRPYLKGQIQNSLALSTLGGRAAVSGDVTDTVTEKAWLSSVKATWSLAKFIAGTDDGPIQIGLAHSDYTTAEILEWINQTASWDQGDRIGQEIAKRQIRRVGVFDTPPDLGVADTVVLNDGKPITTKCGWQLKTAESVKIWAFNQGSSAIATGAVVLSNGHANLWPN